MTIGTRCDGCKDMIDIANGYPFLELNLQNHCPERGYKAVESRHFHGHECLNQWVDHEERFDSQFAELEDSIVKAELVEMEEEKVEVT